MVFISPQKLFPFSRYLSFCLDLVVYQNDLIKKIRLVSNFMTSQPAYKIIPIHVFPNISRSKDNQTMKFGQVIECKMGNIFLEKSCTKFGGETSPRLFSEKLKLVITLDQYSKVLYSLLFCMTSWGLSKHNETKVQNTCFHLILSFFKQ